jgi:SPP1 family predicted phage head-tail adaptor
MISHLLKDSVTVYTVTESISTTTGENVKTNSTGDVIRARISPLSQREIYYANKNNLETTHRMYCDYSTLFSAGDRVAVGTSTYEIMGITNPSEWNKFLQVDLKRVN